MELDGRKLKILNAIVANYLETGEPVGSRTISKFTDLHLSSATIRNEMSDLEELGYIYQPYTSAGRIPSDKGYRVYVNQLMKEKDNEVQEVKDILGERVDKLEMLLQRIAKVLAYNTNYATLVTAPQYKNVKIKFIQLSRIDENQILAVIVVDNNIIRNQVLDIDDEISEEEILKLNIVLNSYLQSLSLNEINLQIIQNIKAQVDTNNIILEKVFQTIVDVLNSIDDLKIYTSGTTNILKYPELGNIEKTTELLEALEEKNILTKLIDEDREDNHNGIKVYIGDEAPVSKMKDCSIVTAQYELEEGVTSTIGIIGPKRMNYDKVVTTLKNLKGELDEIFKKN